MKKSIRLLVMMLMFLAFPIVSNAAEMKYKDIPNGSYIIGEYIYTIEGTGSLTIKEIMLAAKSIAGNELDDMTIIYKTMSGKYVDETTATSEEVSINENDTVTYKYIDFIKDINDEVLKTAESLNNKYYNNYADKTITTTSEEFDSSLFYIEIADYNGTSNPETLTINGSEYKNENSSLSIGLNGKIEAPVWKIDNNKLYVATTWLVAEALPGQDTTIKIGGEEYTFRVFANDVSNESLTVKNAEGLDTQTGYINDVTYEGTRISQKSSHGRHILGITLQSNGTDITETTDVIYRLRSDNTMAITKPEPLSGKNYSYALYLNYNNGQAYTEASEYSLDYKLAIPGKGVITLTVDFEQVADLSQKVLETSESLNNKYYNNYADKTITTTSEEFDSSLFYIEIANYKGTANPETLTINGNEYKNENSSLSIGLNGKIEAPVWKIDNNKLYVATTWLVAEALPGQDTIIEVGGMKYTIRVFANDVSSENLTIKNAEGLDTQTGYTNEVTYEGTSISQKSSHGRHILGITLQSNGTDITETTDVIYRLRSDNTMAITKPEPLSGKNYSYVLYLNYNDGQAYTEASEYSLDYKLAIPGKGVITLTVDFEQLVQE